jgi:cytochrome c peroxidase
MRTQVLLALVLPVALGLFLASCGDDDVTDPAPDEIQALIQDFGLAPLTTIPYPEDNRFLAERISVGRLLFFDPILGGESAPWVKRAAGQDPYRYRANDIACATCHHPRMAFADGRRLGAGVGGAQFRDTDLGPDRVVPGHSLVTGDEVGLEPRNSPTILNAGCNGQNSPLPVAASFQFWDGRVTGGLDKQALLPITSRDEMAGDAYGRPQHGAALTPEAIQDSVAARVRAIPEYVSRLMQAFPGEITSAPDITIDHVGRAIGAFERELITMNSPYDRFLIGERDALNDLETEGFKVFFGKGLCGNCHSGPMLSDFTFRVQGVGDGYEDILPGFGGKNGLGQDWGRWHAGPEFANEKYAFRVATVRNAELTAPYFHSGSAGTLRELVEFYNRGGLGPQDISDAELAAAGAVRDPSIRPLGLTDHEIEAVVAFMRSTTGHLQPGPSGLDLAATPERVPSGLLPPGAATPLGPGPFYPPDTRLRPE